MSRADDISLSTVSAIRGSRSDRTWRPDTVRILIVQPLFLKGGAERQIAALASRFLRKGHSVTLLSCAIEGSDWMTQVVQEGLEVLVATPEGGKARPWISMGYLGRLQSIGILGSYLKRNLAALRDYDIINLHNWPSYLSARSAGLAPALSSSPRKGRSAGSNRECRTSIRTRRARHLQRARGIPRSATEEQAAKAARD